MFFAPRSPLQAVDVGDSPAAPAAARPRPRPPDVAFAIVEISLPLSPDLDDCWGSLALGILLGFPFDRGEVAAP